MKYILSKNVIGELDKRGIPYHIILKNVRDNTNLKACIVDDDYSDELINIKESLSNRLPVCTAITYRDFMMSEEDYIGLKKIYGEELVVKIKVVGVDKLLVSVASCIDLAQVILSSYIEGKSSGINLV